MAKPITSEDILGKGVLEQSDIVSKQAKVLEKALNDFKRESNLLLDMIDNRQKSLKK